MHSTACPLRSRACHRVPCRSTSRPRRLSVLCLAAARCHYQVLGVQPTASADEIKVAFRRLALQLHPDVNGAPNASQAFQGVKDAYEVLSDPQQRAAYNRQRAMQASSTRASYSRSSSWRRGAAVTYQYVVFEEEAGLDDGGDDDGGPAEAGFWGWHRQSGSWQSSWQANSRKQRQRRQQQQQAAAIQEVLGQLPPTLLALVHQVHGARLERLSSLQELLQTLDGLQELQERGVVLDGLAGTAGRGRSSVAAGASRQKPGPAAAKSSSSSRGSSSSRNSSSSSGAASRGSSSSGASSRGAGSSRPRSVRGSGRGAGGGSCSSSSSKARGRLPRFEELSPEELYELVTDAGDPRVRRAARDWARGAAASGLMHPSVAANLGFLLAMDYITADLGDDWGEAGGGLRAVPGAGAGRHKGRARPRPAGDYVRYSDERRGSDDEEEEEEEEEVKEGGGGGRGGAARFQADEWLDVDELFAVADRGWRYGGGSGGVVWGMWDDSDSSGSDDDDGGLC